jgi:hypothetical protein
MTWIGVPVALMVCAVACVINSLRVKGKLKC